MVEISDDEARRARARQLAVGASGAEWFETLYAEAERGEAVVPWDDTEPNPNLVRWAEERGLRGDGRTALVVGCGYGGDAEYLAGLGFRVTAFDISPTAIEGARKRFPDSPVRYVAADLLDTPAGWAFDLVVEIYTVQPLYGDVRARAIAALPGLVAPGGSILVIARATTETEPERDPALMPWPLTRSELDAIAGNILQPVDVEMFTDQETPPKLRWRAEFRHP